MFVPWCQRPCFTPIQMYRQNYCLIYSNVYVFQQRKRILQSLLQTFKYAESFGRPGHLVECNLVSQCRPCKVTATAAGSFLCWRCAVFTAVGRRIASLV
jgi:hypothetical protein